MPIWHGDIDLDFMRERGKSTMIETLGIELVELGEDYLKGRMPVTTTIPYGWYDTPNIHHCTIKDFRQLCEITGVKMERAVALNAWGSPLRLIAPWWFWNLFGEQAVFLLSRKG